MWFSSFDWSLTLPNLGAVLHALFDVDHVVLIDGDLGLLGNSVAVFEEVLFDDERNVIGVGNPLWLTLGEGVRSRVPEPDAVGEGELELALGLDGLASKLIHAPKADLIEAKLASEAEVAEPDHHPADGTVRGIGAFVFVIFIAFWAHRVLSLIHI